MNTKNLTTNLHRKVRFYLKNDGTLPLKENKTIAVIGPNADDIRAIYGDWTYFSHPVPKENVTPMGDYYTIRRGMEEVFGKENIYTAKAVTF